MHKFWFRFLGWGTLMFMALSLCAQRTMDVREHMEGLFKSLRPLDRKTLVEGYTALMNTSFLSQEEKIQVDSAFQQLEGLHLGAGAELKDFVTCLCCFYARQEKENLLVWLGGMEQILASQEQLRTAVKNYLNKTLVPAKGSVLAAANSHQWQVRGKIRWEAGNPIRLAFDNVRLVCTTRKDSICIDSTTGYCLLGEDRLNGKGGKVSWPEPQTEMWVALSRYTIDLKQSSYTADSVWFHYASRYDRPIQGRLKDNALKYARQKEVPYPEFSSYATDIEIAELFKTVSFRGGIQYAGSKFTGIGTEEFPAQLKIEPNDTIAMDLYATQFLIDTNQIRAGKAALVVRMDSGEITHPNINLLYSVPRRTVTVKRISEQSLHVPFKDTYHQILFDMEEMIWPVDSSEMILQMSSRSGLFKATIESLNFFSDNLYDKIQGLDEIHPLNGLLKCSLQLKSNVFTVGDYTSFMKKPADQLRKQIILLSYSDFVDYNEARDEITLKQRLFDYTRSRVGKQDYDNIRFASHPKDSRVNAVLDVRNYMLTIQGVEKFTISEARNIYVEPSDHQVVMLKNRDMEFNGRLNAGMFDMYGQHLFFSYQQYKISLPKVDSTSMYLAGQNKHLRGEKIRSLIRDITGEIVIDKPENKSGRKELPGFPVLHSTKESYVYFDESSIQKGAYKRDSFYYVIKPYTIRGINDAEKFRYAFDGTLVSNIISPIEDTLRLMKDKALGLVYETPASGVELYGKGKIRSRITLNRSGFVANGEVDLNRTSFRSDTILMLPRRMTAHTRDIRVKAVKDRRPEVQGKEVEVEYLRETGNLKATSGVVPFDIYGGRIQHNGTVYVYEDLLDATGKLQLEGADLQAKLFHLQASRILSGSTALKISSILNKDIQLNTSDVQAEIDLLANKGRFINNRETNQAEFASSHYACSFKSFSWYMKEGFLNIGIEEEEQLKKIWQMEDPAQIPAQGRNRFISTARLTDSLNFIAPLAHYDLKSGEIDCHWVNHIDVANGRFYPALGDIFISAGGEIREFQGGRLLCDRNDTSRCFSEVTLRLKGRNTFSGTGKFPYVNEEKKKTLLHFSEIGADTAHCIFAKARLEEKQPLLLNEGFRFKGNMTLYSRQPDFYFDGAVGLVTDSTFLKHQWMAVSDYLQSKHIRIPVKTENRNEKKQRIYNGIYLHTDKVFRPYATFMSNRIFYNDDLLVGGEGKMEWNKALRQYVVSDTLARRYYRFRYDPEECTVSAFSRINLDLKLPGMRSQAAGDIAYNLKEEELKISNLLYAVDFEILPKMKALLQKDLEDKKAKAISMPSGRSAKVYEMLGKENIPVMEKQGKRVENLSGVLQPLWVMDSLSLSWNAKTHTYVASGPVSIVGIGGKPVEKSMNIKMEIQRRRAGNQFFMYIYDEQMWYYFEYSEGSLYTLSSNAEYNEVVKLEKPEKKVIRTPEKEELYTITLCPDSKRTRFLSRIK